MQRGIFDSSALSLQTQGLGPLPIMWAFVRAWEACPLLYHRPPSHWSRVEVVESGRKNNDGKAESLLYMTESQ